MTTATLTPPFRADQVGSLLRPAALLEARDKRKRGELSAVDMRHVEDAAIRDVVTMQEDLGLQSITDGEFRRGLWHMDFVCDFANVYREEIRDLADAGCRYLQIDEVNMAFLCDPNLRDFARSIGEDPARLPHTYANLVNTATTARHRDMTVCLHLCRGNARSHWIADGGYEPVAEVLFNEFNVDGYFLEYDSSRAGDFSPLLFVPKSKRVVLGLVTTKKGALEKKDDIKRRLDEASKVISLDQLALSPQCGFASNAEGNQLTVDEERAKLRLIVEIAREVWG